MSVEFEVGQEVVYQPHGSRDEGRPVTITKVARKYVYAIVYGRESKFDRETGRSPQDFGGRIVTPEIVEAETARASAFERVLHLRSGYGQWGRLTTDQLNRIADIADEVTR